MLSNNVSDNKAKNITNRFSDWCKNKKIDFKAIMKMIQNDFYEKCFDNPGVIIPIGEIYYGNWDGTAARYIWDYVFEKNPKTAQRAAGANYLPYIVKFALSEDPINTYSFYDNNSAAVYRKGRTRTGFLLILDTGEHSFQELNLSETIPEKTIKVLRHHLCDEGRISSNDVSKIKKKLGIKCEVCSEYNFEKHYGEIGKDFIELHHLYHRGKRKDGEIVNIDMDNLEKYFAVLCSNCHKMIHRLSNPKYNRDDIVQLKKLYKK